jgi:predicted outer membrane repeat protein
MHLKLLRIAASTALCGGVVTLGFVSTQAAMAVPATVVNVPCDTGTLITDMTSPADNTVLNLAANCTYSLTGSTGLPTVTNEVTINGHNSWIQRSYGNTNSFSIFVVDSTVESSADLILKSVNVANGGGSGTYDGGAIDIDNTYPSSVSIYGGTFTDNNTTDYGGAISNRGTLTVQGATFTGNSSADGGAISSYNSVATATLVHDTFSHNSASDDGGAIYNNDNNMIVTDSFFNHNSADDGGAIYNYYGLTIKHSQITHNSASSYGGGVYNDDDATINASLIMFNTAGSGAGGIYNDDETYLSADVINLNRPDQCEPLNTIAGCVG